MPLIAGLRPAAAGKPDALGARRPDPQDEPGVQLVDLLDRGLAPKGMHGRRKPGVLPGGLSEGLPKGLNLITAVKDRRHELVSLGAGDSFHWRKVYIIKYYLYDAIP
jgi:hypothetical protein